MSTRNNHSLLLISGLVIVFTQVCVAQIDTTIWYPLTAGNAWFYDGYAGDELIHYSVKILRDTVLPNGKTYLIVERKFSNEPFFSYYYYRYDQEKMYFYHSGCTTQEFLLYDFTAKQLSIWPICGGGLVTHRGISGWGYKYVTIANRYFEVKVFRDLTVSNNDTLWDPLWGSFPVGVAKGIGVPFIMYPSFAAFELVGAIINGTTYGVVNVNEREAVKQQPIFVLAPNPCNNATRMYFQAEVQSDAEICICGIAGNIVKIISLNSFPAGSSSIPIDVSHIPSGIYFVRLTRSKNYRVHKLIIIK